MAENDSTDTGVAEEEETHADHEHDHDHDHDDDEISFVEDPTFTIDYKGECAYEVKVSIPAGQQAKTGRRNV